jgi:hypothetical protein
MRVGSVAAKRLQNLLEGTLFDVHAAHVEAPATRVISEHGVSDARADVGEAVLAADPSSGAARLGTALPLGWI